MLQWHFVCNQGVVGGRVKNMPVRIPDAEGKGRKVVSVLHCCYGGWYHLHLNNLGFVLG